MNVLVTGGGTVAPIDDVRQIVNFSTGGLSARITEACLARGAEVWHLHTPAAQRPFERLGQLDFHAPLEPELQRLMVLQRTWRRIQRRLHLVGLESGTVAEYAAALRNLLATQPFDIVFLTMAVSDFEPEPYPGKLDSDQETLTLTCRATPKVIRQVRDWAPEIYLVGFKLLSGASEEDLVAAATHACEVNRADLTVGNDLTALREGRHVLHLVRPGQPPDRCGPDDENAEQLVERVFAWAREKAAARPPIALDEADAGPD